MHSYSIDSEVRRTIHVFIGVVAFAIPHVWIPTLASTVPTFSWIQWPLSFGATFGFLVWAFNTHAWKWRCFRWMHSIPVLDGTWSAAGTSSYTTVEQPEGFAYQMTVKIKQTFTRLEVHTETESSTSRSTMGAFELDCAVPVFRYAFENKPLSRANDELQRHAGLAELNVHDVDELRGEYFSGRHRTRHGELRLTRRK